MVGRGAATLTSVGAPGLCRGRALAPKPIMVVGPLGVAAGGEAGTPCTEAGATGAASRERPSPFAGRGASTEGAVAVPTGTMNPLTVMELAAAAAGRGAGGAAERACAAPEEAKGGPSPPPTPTLPPPPPLMPPMPRAAGAPEEEGGGRAWGREGAVQASLLLSSTLWGFSGLRRGRFIPTSVTAALSSSSP